MDYKKINRLTCTVCSRFSIVLNENIEYDEYFFLPGVIEAQN